MMVTQPQNHLNMHSSERIPVVKQHMTVQWENGLGGGDDKLNLGCFHSKMLIGYPYEDDKYTIEFL